MNHNDTTIKDEQRLLYQICIPLTLLYGFEKVIQFFMVRGSWRPNRSCNILTPTLMAVNVVSFSFSRAAQPEAQGLTLLGDGFLYCILSATSLDPNSIGASSPFGLVWLFLPHLVYNSVRSLTGTATLWLLSWLSYIIVQRPLSRLHDLWNRILDRHQAEITVMQFTGHSLPVHQSMSVPWEFFTSSHFISQFPLMRFPLITVIRMCHFFPVHQSEWHFWRGRRPKYNIQFCTSTLFKM